MRTVMVAMLLGAGVPGMCQMKGTAAPSFENEKKDAPTVFLLQKQLGKFIKGPPAWQITRDGLLKMKVPLGIGRLGMPSAPDDSAMVVHPPQGSVGVQPPGTAVVQNLYPGLEFMPVGQSKMKVEPIPTTWPGMKLEPIPTGITAYTVVPIQKGGTGAAAK